MAIDGVTGLAAVTGLSSLDDPMRRRLYAYVTERHGPVSRDQAATAMGIGRTLAAYHLDKLTEAGLLSVSYARPAGRGGPGAGRPAKLYRLAADEVAISVPPRAYELLARLLVEAVEHDPSGAVREAVHQAARDTGRRLASDAGADLMDTLRACGYQPGTDEDGEIELRNCPFHRLAAEHRDLVCGLNLHLVQGLIADGGPPPATARLRPRPDRCCVVIRQAPGTGRSGGQRQVRADQDGQPDRGPEHVEFDEIRRQAAEVLQVTESGLGEHDRHDPAVPPPGAAGRIRGAQHQPPGHEQAEQEHPDHGMQFGHRRPGDREPGRAG